jgi:integrase
MGKRTNTAKWIESRKRWQIKVQKDGIRKTFISSTPGRTGQREANAKADAWLDDGIEDQRLLVSISLDRFIESRRGTIAPESTDTESSRIDRWIRPYIGKKRIHTITEGDLQNILDQAGKKGLSKKSIMNIRSIIVLWIKYCRKNKYATLNPEFLEIPKGAPSKKKRILQPDSLKILFSADETELRGKMAFDRYIYAYRFAVLTGIRPGELLGLRWSDIIGDTVCLKRSINKDGRETDGKNGNAKRSFVLTDLAKAVIQAQRQISSTESVFGIESQSTFRHRWQKYCEVNKIQYVSLYELRHTFVSIAKGLSDGELRQLVGYSKNMDTYGVYSHEVQDDQLRTAEKLNDIWGKMVAGK